MCFGWLPFGLKYVFLCITNNTLYIIGNGFNPAHGTATNYHD